VVNTANNKARYWTRFWPGAIHSPSSQPICPGPIQLPGNVTQSFNTANTKARHLTWSSKSSFQNPFSWNPSSPMAVTHASFNVARTNVVIAYDSKPLSQGPPFFWSPVRIPYVPLAAILRGPSWPPVRCCC